MHPASVLSVLSDILSHPADNYKVQNECDSDNLFEVVEQMGKESAELRRHPEVNAYLDAELALCKMMQRICIKLGEGIDIDVPGM